jgi:hypothetical protein
MRASASEGVKVNYLVVVTDESPALVNADPCAQVTLQFFNFNRMFIHCIIERIKLVFPQP